MASLDLCDVPSLGGGVTVLPLRRGLLTMASLDLYGAPSGGGVLTIASLGLCDAPFLGKEHSLRPS